MATDQRKRSWREGAPISQLFIGRVRDEVAVGILHGVDDLETVQKPFLRLRKVLVSKMSVRNLCFAALLRQSARGQYHPQRHLVVIGSVLVPTKGADVVL